MLKHAAMAPAVLVARAPARSRMGRDPHRSAHFAWSAAQKMTVSGVTDRAPDLVLSPTAERSPAHGAHRVLHRWGRASNNCTISRQSQYFHSSVSR